MFYTLDLFLFDSVPFTFHLIDTPHDQLQTNLDKEEDKDEDEPVVSNTQPLFGSGSHRILPIRKPAPLNRVDCEIVKMEISMIRID